MKRWNTMTALALGVILAAGIVFAGCGQGRQEAAPEASAQTAEVSAESEAVAESATESSSEKVEELAAVSEESDAEEEAVQEEAEEEQAGDDLVVRVGAMSGPTAMGLVSLMNSAEAGEAQLNYEFAELSTEASAFVAPLVQGEIDIAAVPANLASVVYNKTEGGIQVLAASVLGVQYIVEKGDSIQNIADLKGHTVYATGQGAVPEAVLRTILQGNDIDIDTDLTMQWCADTTEALSYVTNDSEAVAMLPQPFVTVACAKTEGLHPAINLSDEWAKLENGCDIVTGVVVVRKEFAEQNPEAVAAFMEEYKASAEMTVSDPAACAVLIEKYGIVPKAAIAEKALPDCSVVCITGDELKNMLPGYLQILADTDPQLVGGKVPGEDFIYE